MVGVSSGERMRQLPRVLVAVMKEMGQGLEDRRADMRSVNWAWWVYGGVLMPISRGSAWFSVDFMASFNVRRYSDSWSLEYAGGGLPLMLGHERLISIRYPCLGDGRELESWR